EDVDDPSESDDWPHQLRHISIEGHEAASIHSTLKHLATAQPEHYDRGDAKHEFQGRPEHAHQPNQAQAAADVLLVGALEGGDLGLFLHIGANDAGAGEILLSAG